MILLFALATLCIAAGGYLWYSYEEQMIVQRESEDLAAIGRLKIEVLQEWRRNSLEDGRELASNPLVQDAVGEIRSGKIGDAARSRLLYALSTAQSHGDYTDAALADLNGSIILSTPELVAPLSPEAKQGIEKAIAGRNALITDLYFCPACGHPRLDVISPILDANSLPVGAVILGVDPQSYLYPTIQEWPGTSPSSETILVRRDGDSILYLNELRHQAGSALSLRFPITQTDLPAVQAVLGKEGIFLGRDYRGVEVVADLRPVPDTPWFLVTKVDAAEALAGLAYRASVTVILAVLLALLVGVATAFVYWHREARLLRMLFGAERKEKEGLKRYRTVLYSIGDAVIVTDGVGAIEQMNPEAERLTGWTEAEARGRSLEEVFRIVNEETRTGVENPVRRVLAEGGVMGLANHTLLIARDGTERPVADSAAPVRDTDNRMAGVVLVFRDRTADRAAQRALWRSELRLQSLVTILQHPAESVAELLEVAVEQAVRLTGSRMGNLFRYDEQHDEFVLAIRSKEALEECSLPEPIRGSGLHTTSGFLREAIRRHEPILVNDYSAPHPLKKGYPPGHPWIHRYMAVPVLRGNRVVATVGVANKPTDYDQEDVEQLTLLMDAVWNAVERLQMMEEKDRLTAQLVQAQKMESVGLLAGGIAHDFNNMLGVIIGHADLAISLVEQDHPARLSLQEILKAADRSADLTKQLLAFARKQTISPRIVDLNQVVSDTQAMLRRLIDENIHLHWAPQKGLWPVWIDPSQVEQILVNLVVNARDAISGAGSITIETANTVLDESYRRAHIGSISEGDYVLLAITDTGIGIPEEALPHIFEPFFTTKPKGQGTGLGLATVYGIVKQNEGFIYVYSEPGKGTTFKIYLPRSRAQASQDPVRPKVEGPRSGTETILIVEDEESILQLTKSILEQRGYTVLAASTPTEAVALVEGYPNEIHLLITDVVMPEMNGQQLRERLEQIKPSLRTLFMSGYTSNTIAHAGVLEEGIHFIQKPFSANALLSRVRELLGEPETPCQD